MLPRAPEAKKGQANVISSKTLATSTPNNYIFLKKSLDLLGCLLIWIGPFPNKIIDIGTERSARHMSDAFVVHKYGFRMFDKFANCPVVVFHFRGICRSGALSSPLLLNKKGRSYA